MLKLDISGRMKPPWDGDGEENCVLLKLFRAWSICTFLCLVLMFPFGLYINRMCIVISA